MDKRRSCANCGSEDHDVADCTTYKQGMKSLGYASDEEDISQMEEHEFFSGLRIKIVARCFFCNQVGHFRMDSSLLSEALKNQNHPKHKLALAAVQKARNRQAESDLQNKEATSGELSEKDCKGRDIRQRCWGIRDKELTRYKLRESSCRGYQQSEARLGDQRD